MKLRRTLLIGAAVCAIGFGSFSFGLTGFADKSVNACGDPAQTSVFCGRCGDGQCVKSCGETKTSCPIDCGGSPSGSAKTAAPVQNQ